MAEVHGDRREVPAAACLDEIEGPGPGGARRLASKLRYLALVAFAVACGVFALLAYAVTHLYPPGYTDFRDCGPQYRNAMESASVIIAEIRAHERRTAGPLRSLDDCHEAARRFAELKARNVFDWEFHATQEGSWYLQFSVGGYPHACFYSHENAWREDR